MHKVPTGSNSVIGVWKAEKSKRKIVRKDCNIDDTALIGNHCMVILSAIESKLQLICDVQLHR